MADEPRTNFTERTVLNVVILVGIAVVVLAVGRALNQSRDSTAASPRSTDEQQDLRDRDQDEQLAAMKRDVAELQRRVRVLQARVGVDPHPAAAAGAAPDPVPEPPPQKVVCHELHGTVVAADNRQNIYVLSIGSKDGVSAGMEFEVRRKADTIGRVVVDKVFPNYSSGYRKSGSAEFTVDSGDYCEAVASTK